MDTVSEKIGVKMSGPQANSVRSDCLSSAVSGHVWAAREGKARPRREKKAWGGSLY